MCFVVKSRKSSFYVDFDETGPKRRFSTSKYVGFWPLFWRSKKRRFSSKKCTRLFWKNDLFFDFSAIKSKKPEKTRFCKSHEMSPALGIY